VACGVAFGAFVELGGRRCDVITRLRLAAAAQGGVLAVVFEPMGGGKRSGWLGELERDARIRRRRRLASNEKGAAA